MGELQEKAQKEFADFMERRRKELAQTIRDEADSILSNCYTDYGMYLETDAWINYRAALRLELAGGLYKQITEDTEGHWARGVRDMIFKENRDALVSALNQDLLKQIEDLKAQLTIAYNRY